MLTFDLLAECSKTLQNSGNQRALQTSSWDYKLLIPFSICYPFSTAVGLANLEDRPISITLLATHLCWTGKWNVRRPYRTQVMNTIYRLHLRIRNFRYHSMWQPSSLEVSPVNPEAHSLLCNPSGCSPSTYLQMEYSNTLIDSDNQHPLKTTYRDHRSMC